jgi:aspartyl-tRNA(Asn)/glutamyl-tRNA(Gln) amidotransferase subunit A
VQLAEASLACVSAKDPTYRAFITVTHERAIEDAVNADADFTRGIDRGPMQGIPYALKDVLETAGILTTANSRLCAKKVPEEDADVAGALKRAGGVLLGKLATYEFAAVGPSFDLPFPPPRNPWNIEHATGGSSSGCAVAVAAGMLRTTIGSDTGGSLRIPASHCGVVGLKPTYGYVSCRGLIPLAPSLDHVGPISATVEEAALTLDAIAYPGIEAASNARRHRSLASARIGRSIQGLRLAYPRDFHAGDPTISREVATALDDAASTFASLGARVEEISMPDHSVFETCGAILLHWEAYQYHKNDLKCRSHDYGRRTYVSLVAGFALNQADARLAEGLKGRLTTAVDAVFADGFDAIITAGVLEAAPRFKDFEDKSFRGTATRTMPFNLTGHPALALPTGLSVNGLPLGMQIVGPRFDEATVCQLGAAFESGRRAQEMSWARVPRVAESSNGHISS